MEIKILQVFYGKDGLPYKDKDRQVHFPIAGTGFLGASNTTKIKFYYDELDNLDETTWVAVSKLPNGKVGSRVLESYLDEELNEHYALLELDNYYTQYKGDVFISLQGYQGGVNLDYNEENSQYEIHGTPTIAATGSIKFTINYANQFVGSGETDNINFQRILADLGTKLGIRAKSEFVTSLPSVGENDTFYVIHNDQNDPNKANIYIWNGDTNHYVWVGDNTLDLGEYYTKDQANDFESYIENRVSNVEDELSSIASGSPKGVYSTLEDLETDDPNHNSIYLVLADGKWYYWNSTTTEWTAGGVYQTSEGVVPDTRKVADHELSSDISTNELTNTIVFESETISDLLGIVKYEKENHNFNIFSSSKPTAIKLKSQNSSKVFIVSNSLFDGEWESGTYSGADGSPVDNPSLSRNKNKYIPIPYGYSNLKVSGINSDSMVYFYDEDKTFISMDGLNDVYGVIVPNGARYFNFRVTTQSVVKIYVSNEKSLDFKYIKEINFVNERNIFVDTFAYVFSYDAGITYSKMVSNVDLEDDVSSLFELVDNMVVEGNNHVLDLGYHFTPNASQTPNVYAQSYVASSSEDIYKVFISQELPVLNGNQTLSVGYNCTIWMTFNDRTQDRKLLPVLTFVEMLTTGESFYYDGSIIWVNTGGADYKDFVLSQKDGFELNGINVEFNNLTIRYARNSALKLLNGANVKCYNCKFEYSATESNVSITNANGYFESCETFKARYDGFGITTTDGKSSYTVFNNCIAHYCYDDGISHHNDKCTFAINGGEYHHNHKGGIASPTYGSIGQINNVYSHDNGYGIYAIANSPTGFTLLINGSLLKDNMQNVVGKHIDIILNKTTSVDYTMWADEILDNTGTITTY